MKGALYDERQGCGWVLARGPACDPAEPRANGALPPDASVSRARGSAAAHPLARGAAGALYSRLVYRIESTAL
jgi:hypothetical protein